VTDVPVALTPRTLYATDDVFRALVDTWVRERRCPRPLVDRCLDFGLDTAGACAQWAATERDRPTYHLPGPDEKTSPCGPYPTQNVSGIKGGNWFWMTGWNCASTLPIGQRAISGDFHPEDSKLRPLDAILWLLENWVAT
jgi:hypothetical protein